MSMKEWAIKEVELACKREREEAVDCAGDGLGNGDYGCHCYQSALKAFLSLVADEHSGMSIRFTQNILNALIDGRPLVAIEDTPETWDKMTEFKNETTYTCDRMPGLYKYVDKDGNVRYVDYNRVVGVEINNEDRGTFHNGTLTAYIDKLFPITMPYVPTDKPYTVYVVETLIDEDNGDFDLIGIMKVKDPCGDILDVPKAYFHEVGDRVFEIDEAEYRELILAVKEDLS